MPTVVYAWPLRVTEADTIDLTMFSDITPIQCVSYERRADFAVLTFASNLSDLEARWVKIRMESTPTEETVARSLNDSLPDLRAFLDLTTPTNAEMVAVVRLLVRVCVRLVRITLRDFTGTS